MDLKIPASVIIGVVGMIGVIAAALVSASADLDVYIANFPTFIIVFSFFFLMADLGFMLR